jgi:hypothetical protein
MERQARQGMAGQLCAATVAQGVLLRLVQPDLVFVLRTAPSFGTFT